MIQLQQVERHFLLGEQSVAALAQIDLQIHAGEYVAVMGPSGSGKSTLLNVLGLLDRPDSGHYLLDGIDTAGLSEPALAELRSRSIGFVFQSFHLIPRLSARENIELPLTLAGIAPALRRQRVDELLAQLGIGNRAAHKPAELSGGQRQRVAIGRAIAMSPRLLLADEPTGNRDLPGGAVLVVGSAQSGVQIAEDLAMAGRTVYLCTSPVGRLRRRLQEGLEQGITLVVVTHDPRLGARASRQIRMADGIIVSDNQTAATGGTESIESPSLAGPTA